MHNADYIIPCLFLHTWDWPIFVEQNHLSFCWTWIRCLKPCLDGTTLCDVVGVNHLDHTIWRFSRGKWCPMKPATKYSKSNKIPWKNMLVLGWTSVDSTFFLPTNWLAEPNKPQLSSADIRLELLMKLHTETWRCWQGVGYRLGCQSQKKHPETLHLFRSWTHLYTQQASFNIILSVA